MEKHFSEYVKNLQFQYWLRLRINVHISIGRIGEDFDIIHTIFSNRIRQFWTADAYDDGVIAVESV